jgi:hypothetical protein
MTDDAHCHNHRAWTSWLSNAGPRYLCRTAEALMPRDCERERKRYLSADERAKERKKS